MLRDCAALASELADAASDPVGMGVCELVSNTGQVSSNFTLEWIERDLGAPFRPLRLVSVESDVRAAALAEWSFRESARASSMLYVGVGTGLACSFVDEHGPLRGAHGNAMVLGGTPLEDVASGRGLSSMLGGGDLPSELQRTQLRPEIVSGARELGLAVGILVNALDPHVVVIGGGLGLNDRFRALVAEAIRERIFSPVTRQVPIRASHLGGGGGAIGAALFAGAAADGAGNAE